MKDGHLESKDLMIGDWVNFGGDLPRYSKVTELKTHDIQVCNYWIYEVCITPIPLTPEILEKNWFVRYLESYYFVPGDPSLTLKKIDGEEISGYQIGHMLADVYEPFILITYVHELQHALRLCGLNELADNFKI